ncbi:MAG: hypothetical protein MI922_15220 [Bacteroidales bacterium]|nr:hypothetical protein [Bacteroidales bacterium]
MNIRKEINKPGLPIIIGVMIMVGSCIQTQEERIEFAFPIDSKQVEFAVEEIQSALKDADFDNTIYFFLHIDSTLTGQAYSIERVKKRHIRISGGDETGLMYGGLHVAELISIQQQIPPLRETIQGKPFMNKRGLKLNLPLDLRSPFTYDSIYFSNRAIRKTWNFEFWAMYLDMMARYRYNVLSLWNPHPFSSMVQLDSFPANAHENVYGSFKKIDSEGIVESNTGVSPDSSEVERGILIRKISIEEKIEFWQRVMDYANDRGVKMNFVFENAIPSNILLTDSNDVYHSDNKENSEDNEAEMLTDNRAQSYLQECIKQFLLTYPLAEGVGISFNHEMPEFENTSNNNPWYYHSFIAGILDAKKIQPERDISIRVLNFPRNSKRVFSKFSSKNPGEVIQFLDVGEHMYALYKMKLGKSHKKKKKKPALKRIFILSNGDNLSYSIGDAEYTSKFIESLPSGEITAGFLFESDKYVWNDPIHVSNRQNAKDSQLNLHWYNLMLWGRMGYSPALSEQELKGMMTLHYHGIPVDSLYHSWTTASRIPLLVNKFHWCEPVSQWLVEGCSDLQSGFHDINRFIHTKTLKGSGLINIPGYYANEGKGKKMQGVTPNEVCFQLDSMANKVITFTESQVNTGDQNSETYNNLMHDLKAWGMLGKYYTKKIEAANHFYGYLHNECDSCYQLAKSAVIEAQKEWERYEQFISQNYKIKAMSNDERIAWKKLKNEVKKDVEIVLSHKLGQQ